MPMRGQWLRAIGNRLRRNLTTRLILLLALALLVITGFNDYTRLVREREQLVKQTREDERIFAETLALAVRYNLRRGRTTEELEGLLEEIVARPGLAAVVIYDPDAGVVARTVVPGAEAPRPDELLRRSLSQREAVSSLADSASGRILRYVQPFRWPGGRTGAIEVQQTLREMEREFRRAVRTTIISRLVVLALFVLSIVILTRWNIARPIRALIAAARAVGRGDLGQRIALLRQDEIGELAAEFNRMAENLQTANAELVRQAEERLRLEQEIQQSQKLATVGMLAAEVAHEIGTPLNVISGRAEVLDRAVPSDHPERRNLDVILSQAERIKGIIRALLDYTRPRRPDLRPEPILPIVGRVASLLMERSLRRGVRLHLALPVGLPPVLADPEHLQQVLLNLVLNALDASENGGTVRITAGTDPELPPDGRAGILRGKADAPTLSVHVIDEGKGLSAEDVNHVFEPFFSTKGRGQGTGLGLPIAEDIVRAHRGEIELLSIPGKGTEVILRIPLADTAAAAAGAREEAAGDGR
jgi:two-component system, NtrC family, sensor kinase